MQTKIPIGIDLGTTYSSIAFYDTQRSQPQIISPIEGGNGCVPSYVQLSYSRKTKTNYFIVGKNAKDSNPNYTLYDSKRFLGLDFVEYEKINKETKRSFKVEEEIDGLVRMLIINPATKKEEKFYPEQISAVVLTDLMKSFKAKFPNSEIGKVVITIPVDFKPNQREGTIRACKLAGFNPDDVEFINEPSASIIEYRRNFETQFKEEKNVLVIDFGGGTLDICYCKVKDDKIEVLANGGDANFGGNDFDQLLYDLILEKLKEMKIHNEEETDDEDNEEEEENNDKNEEDKNLSTYFIITEKDGEKEQLKKEKNISKLKRLSEEVKQFLSIHESRTIDLNSVFGGVFEGEIMITREDFENKIEEKGYVQRFYETIKKTMKGFKKSDIDIVIPIGGSCSIPIIKEKIKKVFEGKEFGDDRFDKLLAVAHGAATRAFQIQMKEEKANEMFIDVVPYSIGTLVHDEKIRMSLRMSVFVKRNSHIPIQCRRGGFFPHSDNQQEVYIPLIIGEGKLSTDPGMIELTRLKIDIPEGTRSDDFEMVIYLNMDRSGLIKVNVTREKNGEQLGTMEAKLEAWDYDYKIPGMLVHLKKFGFEEIIFSQDRENQNK